MSSDDSARVAWYGGPGRTRAGAWRWRVRASRPPDLLWGLILCGIVAVLLVQSGVATLLSLRPRRRSR